MWHMRVLVRVACAGECQRVATSLRAAHVPLCCMQVLGEFLTCLGRLFRHEAQDAIWEAEVKPVARQAFWQIAAIADSQVCVPLAHLLPRRTFLLRLTSATSSQSDGAPRW